MLFVIPVLLDMLKFFVLYILHIGGMEKHDVFINALWYGGLFFITKVITYFLAADQNIISILTGFSGFGFVSVFGFFGVILSTIIAAAIVYYLFKLNVRLSKSRGSLGKFLYLLLILFLIFIQLI
jgi:hypothetical protein